MTQSWAARCVDNDASFTVIIDKPGCSKDVRVAGDNNTTRKYIQLHDKTQPLLEPQGARCDPSNLCPQLTQPEPLPQIITTRLHNISTRDGLNTLPSNPTKKQRRNYENTQYIGGMKNPTPQHTTCSNAFSDTLLNATRKSPLPRYVSTLLEGHKADPPDLSNSWADLDAAAHDQFQAPLDPHRQKLRPDVIELLTTIVNDPDTDIGKWTRHGAPMGINAPISTKGVFPPVDPNREVDVDEPYDISKGWSNYKSAEEDQDGVINDTIEKMVKRGWAVRHADMAEVRRLYGDNVPINRIGLVTKEKPDGTIKHRIIWDYRRSGVNSRSDMPERIVLPDLDDAAKDISDIYNLYGEEAVLFGTDIEDAFHNIDSDALERGNTLCLIEGIPYTFTSLVFGSKNAPLIWGRFSAWLARVCVTVIHHLKMQIFVDDPLFMAPRSKAPTVFAMAILLITWIGFPVAWKKTEGGSTLRWVGAMVHVDPSATLLRIPKDKATQMLEFTNDLSAKSRTSVDTLRRYAGKVSHHAQIIPNIRPFIDQVWAAIKSVDDKTPNASQRAATMIPTNRVRHSLRWLLLFYSTEWVIKDRRIPFSGSPSSHYRIHTDASPWGIGGVLTHEWHPIAYFHDKIHQADLRRFHASAGESKFMPVWEALAILVAIHLWHKVCTPDTTFELRVDSLGVVLAQDKRASRDPNLNAILRELALHEARVPGLTIRAAHTYGDANTWPDALSRLHEPGGSYAIPQAFWGATCVTPPARRSQFWSL